MSKLVRYSGNYFLLMFCRGYRCIIEESFFSVRGVAYYLLEIRY